MCMHNFKKESMLNVVHRAYTYCTVHSTCGVTSGCALRSLLFFFFHSLFTWSPPAFLIHSNIQGHALIVKIDTKLKLKKGKTQTMVVFLVEDKLRRWMCICKYDSYIKEYKEAWHEFEIFYCFIIFILLTNVNQWYMIYLKFSQFNFN